MSSLLERVALVVAMESDHVHEVLAGRQEPDAVEPPAPVVTRPVPLARQAGEPSPFVQVRPKQVPST